MELFSGIMIYILIFSITMIIKDKNKKKVFKCLYVISTFLILLVISGCRGLEIGTDTPMFVRAYYRLYSFSSIFSSYTERFEFGYRLFNAVLNQVSNSPHILLFMSSLITIYLIYIFFYNKSKYFHISIIMFVSLMYYCNSMCLLRQYLAMSFCCLAIMKLSEEKNIDFIIWVIIGFLFHSSAIIFLILLPMKKINIIRGSKLKLFLISLGIVFFANKLINIFINILPQYTSYLSSEKYYLENQLGSYLKAGLQGIMFIIINMYFNIKEDNKGINKLGYLCSLVAFSISLISIQGAILERMGFYFSIINCVTIPNMIYNIKSTKEKYIVTIGFCIICITYFYLVLYLRPNWSGVIPYIFWE